MHPGNGSHAGLLLFVYNADSGFGNALVDAARKLVAPASSPCHLCSLTHGAFAMKSQWRRFLGRLHRPVQFLHRDQFLARFGAQTIELPAVFLVQHGSPHLLLPAPALRDLHSLDALQTALLHRLASGSGIQALHTLPPKRSAPDLRSRA